MAMLIGVLGVLHHACAWSRSCDHPYALCEETNCHGQQTPARKLTTSAHRYSEITKQFAMTLHYYSPKAYEFVRKILKPPYSSSIKHWAALVDCEPGYLTNVIQAIGKLAERKVWMKDVVLIVNAMSIHKMTMYDKKQK